MSWPAIAQPALPADDEVFVLHARPLRTGTPLELTPRLSDDIWPLSAAILQLHTSAKRLNFLDMPERYRQAAKQCCYAMLSGSLPAGEQRRSISTIMSVFTHLKRFFSWLDNRGAAAGGPLPLGGLTAADLRDYHRHLAVTLPAPGRRASARSALTCLWRYRHALPADGQLAFDPRHLDEWHQGRPGGTENATNRIPESVLGPLLAWSMRFTRDFAPDILAACSQWHAYHRPRHGRPATAADARRLLREQAARHQPLPGRDGHVNIYFLAKTLGCTRRTLDSLASQIDQAAATAGITPWTCYDLPITGQLDDQPWIGGIATDPKDPGSLDTLTRLLQAACYTIIAFLSGMRDSEVKHLRRGCLQVSQDTDGRPYRWKIASVAFKGERDPAGTAATWIVGEPVARAIDALEQLQPGGTDLLFTPLPYGHGTGPASRSPNLAARNSTTNRQLNELAAWINDYCRAHGRSDTIPPVSGQSFRLLTRQFRRTLAWFIARQPGGAIAGAIQYRHLSIQMFEGYAGTSDSGFRAEVESEQALARGEHLLAVINRHEHEYLTGPAASEAARRLRDFGERARFRGIVVTDDRQLQRLILRHDPAIYPGTYATCVYNPDKALCEQQHDSRGTLRPALGHCRPLECRNTALTTANQAALRGEITAITRQLASRPGLPPLLQARLAARAGQITEFLSRYPESP